MFQHFSKSTGFFTPRQTQKIRKISSSFCGIFLMKIIWISEKIRFSGEHNPSNFAPTLMYLVISRKIQNSRNFLKIIIIVRALQKFVKFKFKIREILTDKVYMHGPFRHHHLSGPIPSISSAQVRPLVLWRHPLYHALRLPAVLCRYRCGRPTESVPGRLQLSSRRLEEHFSGREGLGQEVAQESCEWSNKCIRRIGAQVDQEDRPSFGRHLHLHECHVEFEVFSVCKQV